MQHINIEEYIKSSNSKILKLIPGFTIKRIEKIVRQDEINRIINDYSEFEGGEFLSKVLEDQNIKVQITGEENLPDSARCFFVANHPFGLMDSIILNSMIWKKYGDIRAIGNEIFHFIPNLRTLIVSVNVFGKNSRQAIVELNKVYSSDLAITHFPYGFVSRISKLKIQDKIWKKSFVKKAIMNKRDIVPIRFYGRNSNLFYFIFMLRKILGIKANLELMFLPRELFRKKNSTIKLRILKPVKYQDLDKSKSHAEWAEELRSSIYQI